MLSNFPLFSCCQSIFLFVVSLDHQKHKLVHKALQEELDSSIHALSIVVSGSQDVDDFLCKLAYAFCNLFCTKEVVKCATSPIGINALTVN